MFFETPAQCGRLPMAAFDKGYVAAPGSQLGKVHEHVIKEKAEPDALAPAVFAHQVQAVVPVAGADERQAVVAEFEAVQDGPDAMLVKARRFIRTSGQVVIRVFIRVYRAALEEENRFIQHAGVPAGEDVTAGGQRQPEVIVGAKGTHTPTRGRMPPMLNISFQELTGRAPQQVLAHQMRPGVDERHHVLQLIAETVGPARLIKPGAAPQPATQGLIQQPAVGQHVHG